MIDDTDTLSPAEAAYIESRGTAGLPEEGDPAPEPEKPIEKAPDPEKKPDDDPEVMKLVPLSAVEALRAEKRAIKEELAAYKADVERERAELQAKLNAPKADPNKPAEKPDPKVDPVGYLAWKDAQDTAAEAAKKAEAERTEAQKRVATIGQNHARTFVQKQPDYFDSTGADGKPVQGAYSFLRVKAAEAIQAKNPTASMEEIARVLDLHELNEIQDATRSGENVAERFYKMALEVGYTAPKAPEVKSGPTEAERIAELEKAQRGAKSLGSVPAGGGEPELSLKAVADMDDDEFAALPAATRRKLLGG